MIKRDVKFTYRDYINLPESEEKRYELIAGELLLLPSPTPIHQDIVGRLFRILYEHVQARKLGTVLISPLDVVLSDKDVLQPDILYISRNREGIITEQNIRGAPDLVVEVLSPGTADRDRTLKRARYLKFGVREYWIVDPQARSVEVLKAGQSDFEAVRVFAEGTTATSPVLEGLEVYVSGIFGSTPDFVEPV